MAEKILMIALSPTMEEGTIVKWNKNEGDTLSAGDVLCEVETDKATMEYEAQAEGTLLKILVPEGGQARVADPIAISGEPGEDVSGLIAEAQAAKQQPAPRPASAQEQKAPEPAAGAPPQPGTQAPAAPLRQQQPATAAAALRRPVQPAVPVGAGPVKASPLARRMASDRGIDISRVPGTGPAGRVVKRDIEGYQPPAAAPGAVSRPALVDEEIPVSGKRAVIARRLAESKFQAPHYYLTVSFEMDGLMGARARLNARRPEKVSLNAFVVRLCAEALKRNPMVNASWQGETIRKFGSADIGLAVAVPDGLITPVVRDCGGKGLVQVDEELKDLIPKAQSGKLLPEEYTGATFTISNLGTFGIDEFTAVINPPGSAILALGRIQKAPVVSDDDGIEIRSLMKATLSCDHRVIDGVTGARFLSDLKGMIEDPFSILY